MTNEVRAFEMRANAIFPEAPIMGDEFDPKVQLRCGISVVSEVSGGYEFEFVLLDDLEDSPGLSFSETLVGLDDQFGTYLKEVMKRSDVQLYFPLNMRPMFCGHLSNFEFEESVEPSYHARHWIAHFIAHHFDVSATIRRSKRNVDIIYARVETQFRLSGEVQYFHFFFSLSRERKLFDAPEFVDRYLGLMPESAG